MSTDKPPQQNAPGHNNPSDPLGIGSPSRRGGRRALFYLPFLLLAGFVIWYFMWPSDQAQTPHWDTAQVVRGDLTVTVNATGTLQPTNQVDVGSELSGIISAVMVDDNSQVKKGQILAQLDVSKLNDQIANSQAALEAARAAVLQAQASRAEAAATLKRQQDVYRLSGGKVPSKSDLETAEAKLAGANADVASAKAKVTQAEATLRSNQTDLQKASIRSPINGVVLSRDVEPGQTVAASYQAPVLFTLAEDLKRMELQVNVDEADVGQVRAGQHATFTVDAYPNRQYPASIARVRYGATNTNNVVTYLAVLEVNNDDLSLRPGMTASADIVTAALHDVLLVPNAALRFTPPTQTGGTQTSLVSSLLPHRPRRQKTVRINHVGEGKRQLWLLRAGQPVPLEVNTGATDGRMTQVISDDLKAGDRVITGIMAAGSD